MEIRKNSFKQKILKFEKQIGIWSCLSNNTVAEILSIVGFDWIVIDMEHSPNDIQEVLTQLQIIQGFSSEPIVRVPWNEPVMVKRVLDMGAQTILFPYVEDEHEALAAVQSTRYPPKGVRGVMSAARMNKYGTVTDYYNKADEQICVLVQCETKKAIENISKIAAVEGIDGIFLGPSDLSASIGKIGQFEDGEVQSLIYQGLEFCKKVNKPAGILTAKKDYAKKYAKDGFTYVAINSDTNLITRSAENLLKEFK
jgi:4-hydroxy-2-oxoheptanedioate aldolase